MIELLAFATIAPALAIPQYSTIATMHSGRPPISTASPPCGRRSAWLHYKAHPTKPGFKVRAA
eukprot:12911979-Prorocentrum_lima.AAC.1